MMHWPRPRVNAPPRTPGAQLHQPARRPGHPVRQPDSTQRQHAGVHHDHHPDPTATAGLRTPGRLPPPRPGVVSTTTPATPKRPGQHPNPSTNQGELRAKFAKELILTCLAVATKRVGAKVDVPAPDVFAR